VVKPQQKDFNKTTSTSSQWSRIIKIKERCFQLLHQAIRRIPPKESTVISKKKSAEANGRRAGEHARAPLPMERGERNMEEAARVLPIETDGLWTCFMHPAGISGGRCNQLGRACFRVCMLMYRRGICPASCGMRLCAGAHGQKQNRCGANARARMWDPWKNANRKENA
jgi:hypothetical protein